jgi:hypothetical protein
MERTVIQHQKNGRYLSRRRAWKKLMSEAQIFRNGVDALCYCRRHQISDAQIVVIAGGHRLVLTLEQDVGGETGPTTTAGLAQMNRPARIQSRAPGPS